MLAPSEASAVIQEHKVEYSVDAQRANELFQGVALAYGVDLDHVGKTTVKRTKKGKDGEILEDLDFKQSTREISMLKITRPGMHVVTIVPRQEKLMMIHEGSISVELPDGQKLARSEEAYFEANNAVISALQRNTPQA